MLRQEAFPVPKGLAPSSTVLLPKLSVYVNSSPGSVGLTLDYKADGVEFIVQSGIQIKVIGSFLMGLMGVEGSILAAGEAAQHWQEAYPVLSAQRYAKQLSPHLLGLPVWIRKPARRLCLLRPESFVT